MPAGDLTDQLLAHGLLDRRDGRRRRHPDRRRPVRHRRRRHRQLRDGRLPADRRGADRADPGPAAPRPPVADLRVPHPRLPDPPRRAAALRLRVAPGQHLGLPVLRASAKASQRQALKVALAGLFAEPIFADYCTPKAGQVFEALEREANRIRYTEMLVKGLVRMVRRRDGGGYFTILTPPEGASATKRVAYRSQLRAPRRRLPGAEVPARPAGVPRPSTTTTSHVVNAYEPHEHVYERLMQHPAPCWCAAAASSPRACCSG